MQPSITVSFNNLAMELSSVITFIPLFIVYLGLNNLILASDTNIKSVVQTWRSLGWKSLTLIGSMERIDYLKWLQQSSKQSVSVAVHKLTSHRNPNICNLKGYIEIIEDLDTMRDLLGCRRPSESTMVLIKSYHVQRFITTFGGFNKSRTFYRISNGSIYHQITFRDHNHIVGNEISCNLIRCFPLMENFDFKGLSISGETLNWEPWISLQDCSLHEMCSTSGILSDIMDLIAHQKNFTWNVRKSDTWGTVAFSNGSYGGVYGQLKRDEQDLPLASWANILERFDTMDITTSISESKFSVVVNKNNQPVEFLLYLHPFTLDSWMAVGSMIILIIALLYIPSCFTQTHYEGSLAQNISVISSWGFFILIHGIYGGALTMFFTTSYKLPFESLHEALGYFPDWKLVLIKGNEYFLQRMLTDKPSAINNYWEYLHSKDGEMNRVKDETEILHLLKKPGYFYYGAQKDQLQNIQKHLQIPNMDLQTISIEQKYSTGIGLPKYSPWTKQISPGNTD